MVDAVEVEVEELVDVDVLVLVLVEVEVEELVLDEVDVHVKSEFPNRYSLICLVLRWLSDILLRLLLSLHLANGHTK